MIKKYLLPVAVLFLLPIILLTFIAWYFISLKPVDNKAKSSTPFTIATQESATEILKDLYGKRLIRSVPAAKIYLKISAHELLLKPGNYLLPGNLDTPALIDLLQKGPKDVKITFPEGWRREQYAVRLKANLPDFDLEQFIKDTATLEGKLFPDTYLFPPQASPQRVISLLIKNFTLKSGLEENKKYSVRLGKTATSLKTDEVLILASLLEREANIVSDRPVIAGILIKRLNAGWPLQIDATVQYAKDTENFKNSNQNERRLGFKFWEPISDTGLPSAYNTYQNPGLPPAPIANPGAAAIEAVLKPEDSPYWYYLTGPDGVTYYAATLEEHNRNVDKYLRS